MNYKDLKLQSISYDVKYIFTNEGILETKSLFSNDNTEIIDYSFDNLKFGLQIMKEHYKTFYNANQMSLIEYSNSPRKALYRLLEIFEVKNSTSIIKEWEEVYGKKLLLINESVDKLIVESRVENAWNSVSHLLYENMIGDFFSDPLGSIGRGVKNVGDWVGSGIKRGVNWVGDQAKQIQDKGFFTWAGEKVSNAWTYVKDAVSKAWKCLTDNFFECLMEGIRSALFSAVGMGVMTAISFIPGVGQVADVLAFGALVIWDIYKMLSGKYESGPYKWSWTEIIIDAICAALPALGLAFKAAARGIRSFAELGVSAATKGGIFAKVLNFFKSSIGLIFKSIGKAATWVGEKLGLQFLTKFGTKAETILAKETQIAAKAETTALSTAAKTETKAAGGAISTAKQRLKDAGQGLKQFTKDFKFIKPFPVVAKASGKTIMITAGLCAALGLDGWSCQHKIENGEVSEEQLKKAQEQEKEIMTNLQSGQSQEEIDKLSVADAKRLGII